MLRDDYKYEDENWLLFPATVQQNNERPFRYIPCQDIPMAYQLSSPCYSN